MYFLKPYRFLVLSFLILVGYYAYYASNSFPKDEELIRIRGVVSNFWETNNSIKLKFTNDHFGTSYARISKNSTRGVDYQSILTLNQEIWIDVLQDDFYGARFYSTYNFNVFGFGISERTISSLEDYNENKKIRYIAEFLFFLIIIIGLDLIVRKRSQLSDKVAGVINKIPANRIGQLTTLWHSFGKDIGYLILGLSIITWSLFIHFTNNRVFEQSDLKSLDVYLSEKPEYNIYIIKGVQYREINLKALGYTKLFIITNFTYKYVDHQRLKNDLDIGSIVTIWLTENDFKNLKEKQLVNNYNEVFRLEYDSQPMIDFDKRNLDQNEENKLTKVLLGILGTVVLIISFFRIRKTLLISRKNQRN
uniref:hypothetical protein n=1 Tax=Roseivirga sp. TaxID=1964215 RepID=UPI0040480FD5